MTTARIKIYGYFAGFLYIKKKAFYFIGYSFHCIAREQHNLAMPFWKHGFVVVFLVSWIIFNYLDRITCNKK